ncbi:helix-turn-helix domain-containing protein [Mycobacterium sp.]|uniref:helix-turn-helix domain-containing protein n=1 Tax=Mycobacterium sp. TaxID=1785 RepID=UPI003C78E818
MLGLLLLVAFPSSGEPRGLGEVADQLRMPHSTAHRYIKTLAGMGLLKREPGRRGYRRALGSDA